MILSKLKEMPHEVSIDESPQVEMNPMPLVQDVGLPLVDDNGYIVDVNQNGIELSANSNGEFFFEIKISTQMKVNSTTYQMITIHTLCLCVFPRFVYTNAFLISAISNFMCYYYRKKCTPTLLVGNFTRNKAVKIAPKIPDTCKHRIFIGTCGCSCI